MSAPRETDKDQAEYNRLAEALRVAQESGGDTVEALAEFQTFLESHPDVGEGFIPVDENGDPE